MFYYTIWSWEHHCSWWAPFLGLLLRKPPSFRALQPVRRTSSNWFCKLLVLLNFPQENSLLELSTAQGHPVNLWGHSPILRSHLFQAPWTIKSTGTVVSFFFYWPFKADLSKTIMTMSPWHLRSWQLLNISQGQVQSASLSILLYMTGLLALLSPIALADLTSLRAIIQFLEDLCKPVLSD